MVRLALKEGKEHMVDKQLGLEPKQEHQGSF